MSPIQKGLVGALLCLFFSTLPGAALAQDTTDTKAVIELLNKQHSKLSADLRRIHREIAALRADQDNPGVQEIFSGIGYIFGLFGVAAYVASRRHSK
jgi:cell division protein FtsB